MYDHTEMMVEHVGQFTVGIVGIGTEKALALLPAGAGTVTWYSLGEKSDVPRCSS